MTPKFVRGRSEGVPGAFAKMSQKTTPKTKPKGSQIGVQMGAASNGLATIKMSPKTRSLPEGSLGRPRVEKAAKMESKWSKNGVNIGVIWVWIWEGFCMLFGTLVGCFWECLWLPFRNIIE